MSDELVSAAKAAHELGPAARQFAEAIGRSGPGLEVMAWLGDMIRFRRLPHQAKLLMNAAKKIEASGLPTSAVPDKLLRAVLEEGCFEDDDHMQERWSSLLAGAATGFTIPPAFPEILRQLTANEARALDRLLPKPGESPHNVMLAIDDEHMRPDQLDNIERLGLVAVIERSFRVPGYNGPRAEVRLSDLGVSFVLACRAP